MSRLTDGDRSAFEPLYLELRPRAERAARMRLDPAAAEDVAQAALLRVFSRASEFERGRPLLPWFYAIVGNEIRAVTRRARLPAPAEVVAPPDAEAELTAREIAVALDRAIASLDDDAAQAIRAVLDEAPRPNVAPATFRKRVSRAYSRLRAILGMLADV